MTLPRYNTDAEWLTVAQVAARLRRPVRTVRHHCAAGVVVGAKRVGTVWMIPAGSVEAYREFEPYDGLRRENIAPPAAAAVTQNFHGGHVHEHVTPRDARPTGTARVRHLSSVHDLRSTDRSRR